MAASSGKAAFLGSLSFRAGGLEEVRAPQQRPQRMGAEQRLAFWFQENGQEVPVYRFGAGGALEILAHCQQLARQLELDALVLIDGGTDSLLRGDEPGLGSPGEDVASLAAAHQLELPARLLACLGFGLDAHHHVCHAYMLEAAADLTASGDFLGAFSVLAGMLELQFLAEAVDHAARQPETRPSMIASSVVAAARGQLATCM